MINKKLTKKCFTILSFSMIISMANTLSANEIKLKSDNDYLVTSSRPGNILVVDLKTNEVVNNCKIDEKYNHGVLLSPDYKTAFILGNGWEEIGGYNIETCKKVFHTNFSAGNIKGKSTDGLAISSDGKELYATYNRTELGSDRYIVKDPYLSVYNISDGLSAKPVKNIVMPRQMCTISAADNGKIYGTGAHFYEIDPKAGTVEIAKKMRDWDKPGYSNPDFFSPFITGQTTKEYSILHSVFKFKDEKQNMDEATPYVGITTIDLTDGKITQSEFTIFETIMFTAMHNPKDKNILYGVLNDLSMFDLKNKKLLKRVPVDHTYYNVAVSPDGEKVYTGSTLNDISIYDAKTLDKLGNIQLPEGDMGGGSLQIFHNI